MSSIILIISIICWMLGMFSIWCIQEDDEEPRGCSKWGVMAIAIFLPPASFLFLMTLKENFQEWRTVVNDRKKAQIEQIEKDYNEVIALINS